MCTVKMKIGEIESRRQDIPAKAGIYKIEVPDGMEIYFDDPAPEDRGKAAYDPARLSEIYKKNGCSILYIGKAGGKRGLRQRLMQYARTLFHNGKSHRGGRAIRQIRGFENLIVECKTCKDRDECDLKESAALKKIRQLHGNYPVANRRG